MLALASCDSRFDLGRELAGDQDRRDHGSAYLVRMFAVCRRNGLPRCDRAVVEMAEQNSVGQAIRRRAAKAEDRQTQVE